MKTVPFSRKRQLSAHDDVIHHNKRMRLTPGRLLIPTASATPGAPSIAKPRIVPVFKRNKQSTPRAPTPPVSTRAHPPVITRAHPPPHQMAEAQAAIKKSIDDAGDRFIALNHVTDYISNLKAADIAKYSGPTMVYYKQVHPPQNRENHNINQPNPNAAQTAQLLNIQKEGMEKMFQFMIKELSENKKNVMTSTFQEMTAEKTEDWQNKIARERIKRSIKRYLLAEDGGRYLWKVYEAWLTQLKVKGTGVWNEINSSKMNEGTNAMEKVGPNISG
eukprot:900523_1